MNIQIINCQAGRDSFDTEGRTDVKTVPCITVVSCLEGAYDVVINGEPYTIRGGEYFYTPEDAAQTIVHHICPDGRPMRAQWLYMAIGPRRHDTAVLRIIPSTRVNNIHLAAAVAYFTFPRLPSSLPAAILQFVFSFICQDRGGFNVWQKHKYV